MICCSTSNYMQNSFLSQNCMQDGIFWIPELLVAVLVGELPVSRKN